jgi:dTDP-4-dehydrorhamnose reductase
MPINILVTGSNGQLGKELQYISNKFLDFHFIFTTKEELLIQDESVVHYFFEKYTPLYCINCAAYTAVDNAETEKELAYAINVIGTKNLAEAATKFNCTLIHISTDYVFDGEKKAPYLETDVANPLNYYGFTKLEGEKIVLQESIKNIIIRTSWLYSSYGNNFVITMLRLMQEKESINVINDQIGAPTYASSLANLILEIINKIENEQLIFQGIFHYSSTAEISWFDFANAIKEFSNSTCLVNSITTSNYPTAAKRSLYSVLDKTKIITILGLELKNWKKELKECIAKIKNQKL